MFGRWHFKVACPNPVEVMALVTHRIHCGTRFKQHLHKRILTLFSCAVQRPPTSHIGAIHRQQKNIKMMEIVAIEVMRTRCQLTRKLEYCWAILGLHSVGSALGCWTMPAKHKLRTGNSLYHLQWLHVSMLLGWQIFKHQRYLQSPPPEPTQTLRCYPSACFRQPEHLVTKYAQISFLIHWSKTTGNRIAVAMVRWH